MPRILLPPSCGGFADGDKKYLAERGPGSFVNIDDSDPAGRRALEKLRGQDYVQAGLVLPPARVAFLRRQHDCRVGEAVRSDPVLPNR